MTTETGGVRRNIWLAVLGWIAVLAAVVIVLERRNPIDTPLPSTEPVGDVTAPKPSVIAVLKGSTSAMTSAAGVEKNAVPMMPAKTRYLVRRSTRSTA